MKTPAKIGLVFGVVACFFLILNIISAVYDSHIGQWSGRSFKLSEPLELKHGELIEINRVGPSELVVGEYNELFYVENLTKRPVVYQGNPISQLNFSASKNMFGYLVNYDIYDDKIPYDKKVLLYIEDIKTRKPREVFHGSFKTSWEWFSGHEILISEGCGTECQLEYLINLTTGKKYILQYGVGYTWSPDKNWVFAYNYSYRTGITIGDKFGKIILSHKIIPPKNNESTNTPLAAWSPDSTRLALIMKKPDDKAFELLVFTSGDNFSNTFQSDLDYAKKFELKWASDSKSLRLNGKTIIK